MATADKLVARFTEEGGNAGVNSLALCKRSYLGYDRVVSLTSLLVAKKKKRQLTSCMALRKCTGILRARVYLSLAFSYSSHISYQTSENPRIVHQSPMPQKQRTARVE